MDFFTVPTVTFAATTQHVAYPFVTCIYFEDIAGSAIDNRHRDRTRGARRAWAPYKMGQVKRVLVWVFPPARRF
jgi:hypothetical protein